MATATKNRPKTRPMLTPQELADRWGMHYRTILERIDEGSVPAKRVGRQLRIPLAWVEKAESAG